MSLFNAEQISGQFNTIGDFLRFSTSELNRARLFFGHGYATAWDEAQAIVSFAIDLSEPIDESLFPCRLLLEEKLNILNVLRKRIEKQCPVAYLTNRAYFAGLLFYVDERVLVPRSPIAELIEQKFTHQLIEQKPNRILDLCTGSGCIAIACAYAFPEAEIDAVDLSVDALNVAQINIEYHGLEAQVIPIQSDIFSGVEQEKYDLIVTNPPYVDEEDVNSMPAEYEFEPEIGLGSGKDGLNITRQILASAAEHLTDNGVLICEVGNSQIHVEQVYPELPLNWITFEQGGHGVFSITKQQLTQFDELLKRKVTTN